MNRGKVSIIMPAYNAEKFLPRSIESVQRQSYEDWELLIVDDGSTDDSRAIVKEYAAKDTRVHLFCNQHGGTARARNTAIEAAEGDYFAFIDADDVYHPRYLECLIDAICKEDADMAVCEIARGMDATDFLASEAEPGYTVISMEEAFSTMYGGAWGKWDLMISPWNKLYVAHLFEKIHFPDGRYFEDAATINLTLYDSKRICVLQAPLYYYFVTPASSSKTKRSVELLDREWALRSHWELFRQEGREDLVLCAIPFYLMELISIYHRIETSDRPADCQIIRSRFESVYRIYRRKVVLTTEQRDQILAFRNPYLYDIRNMIRQDGIAGTLIGMAKRKIKK